MGVIALLGGEEGVVFEDASSLPAILRRAAVLMSAGLAPESVASMTAQTARQGFDVVIGQGEDRPDCYFGSSTAAIGRALRKLAAEPGNGAFWVRLGELGFPADTVQYLGVGEVCPEAMAAATSGAPSGTGAVVRISIREEGACIGPVHCGPYCRSDAEAVTWLRG